MRAAVRCLGGVVMALVIAGLPMSYAAAREQSDFPRHSCAGSGGFDFCVGQTGEDLTLDGSETIAGHDPGTSPASGSIPRVEDVDTSLPEPPLDPRTLERLENEYYEHVTACANAEAAGDQEFYQANCVEDEVVDEPAPEPPPVTPDIVRRQLEAIQLPPGQIGFQPAGRALVNKEVIFYCETPRNDTYDLQILGRDVRATIHVVSYRWTWGDGQTLNTDKPGAPYPSFDVNHIYEHTGNYTVRLVLDYTASFQIAGGPTVDVPGVVASPPATVDLPIVSATTVLVAADDEDHTW